MKKELTFKSFYACMEQQKNSGRPISFENIDFSEDLEVRFEHRHCSLVFVGCVFNGRFESKYLASSTSVSYNDCQMKGDIMFSSSGKAAECKISFISTRIDGNLTVEEAINLELEIIKQSSLSDVNLTSSVFAPLKITDTLITGECNLNEIKSHSGIIFHKVEFSGPLDIAAVETSLQLSRVATGNSLQLTACRFSALSMENMNCFQVRMNSCAVSGTFLLTNNVFEDEFMIQNVIEPNFNRHFEKIIFRDNEFKSSFYVLGSEQDMLSFNSVEIIFNDRLKGSVLFRHAQIQQLSLSGNNLSASVTFSNSSVQRLSIERFINRGLLNFIGLNSTDNNGTLNISHSVMGKTYLSDCYLNSYEDVNISHSNLSELGTASTRWFKLRSVNEGLPKNERASAKRDLFRQLKMIMEKQGDTNDRLNFRREEMRAFRAEPKGGKSIGDRITMTLNLSNSDGQNWILPVYLLLLFTLMAYASLCLVLVWSDPRSHFNPDYKVQFFQKIHAYFILLNPTHRVVDLEMIKNGHGEFYIYMIDFIHRVGLSYLLFQIVTAFRKFHR